MKKIGISTDCLCDLPEEYLKANHIEVMHFYIYTATGRFRDGEEITSDNVLEYLGEGERLIRSNVPVPEEYQDYFENLLEKYDEVVHINTSDKVGLSYPNASAALELMGEKAKRITVVNSLALSSGMGHMVTRVVAMRDNGSSAEEIVRMCGAMRGKIASSFIAPNADYLYQMGYVGKAVKDICRVFNLHLVLYITDDGKLSLKSFRAGDYEKAVMRYVRSEFKHPETVEKRQLFITHAGCPSRILQQVRDEARRLCDFDKITVTKACAAISSNCGPGTVGVLFVNK